MSSYAFNTATDCPMGTSSDVILFDRSRQNLTRAQEHRIRCTFPFLRLPAELRNKVYEEAMDTSAAQKILQRYYEDFKDAKNTKDIAAPLIYSKCPTIFRINRQIYAEASFLVRKRGLEFDHGLLDLLTIKDFVPNSLIQTVSSININDSGHPLFKDNILAASWMGYITLIEEIATILKTGPHNLKTFTITLSHPELVPHVTTCWHASYSCGFRDSMRRVADAMRGVRGIGEVNFIGFPEPLASQLKERMQAPPTSFLDLPRELRDQIYGEALDWSDISTALKSTLKKWTDKTREVPYPRRSTPTVLLLNRQITQEALEVLHKTPLVLSCPAEHKLLREKQVPNLARFISRPTLQQVRHLTLHLEAWEWIHGLKYVLPVFASDTTATTTAKSTTAITTTITPNPPTNLLTPPTSPGSAIPAPAPTTAGPQHLKTLHIHFHDALKPRFLADPTNHYPDDVLHGSLRRLAAIRGLERVVFAGDLPAAYTGPLARIMTAAVGVGEEKLPRVMAVRGGGEKVEFEVEEEGLVEE